MTFKVAARTILQLGSELISSDSIAFYELIKNGFDAGSSRVEIEFLIRIPGVHWDDCHAALFGGDRMGFSDGPIELEAIRKYATFQELTAPHRKSRVLLKSSNRHLLLRIYG